jgi:hypothetical protein
MLLYVVIVIKVIITIEVIIVTKVIIIAKVIICCYSNKSYNINKVIIVTSLLM